MTACRADWRHGVAGIALIVIATGIRAAASDDPGAESFPNPELSPDQVVRIQLEALRANDAADHGIEICFRFASPSNKSNTGPLARFVRMIKQGPYQLMLEYQTADFEPVEIIENVARQRVTLSSTTHSITYAFYLSRQTGEECKGCWMTDAVTVEKVNTGSA